ncbi:tyrosine-protein phosphatase non-receptor type 23 [Callorhinchus milii]|uniref:tyrosine-protein phosphatase non-receptor type 23 n=1 Tax=Callorhinchus milii TaxID=7868 RepID=UPI001C3F8380|nr:tyrosine-protein phosphatase non-receptor type 23 [Callorhinchus milii]
MEAVPRMPMIWLDLKEAADFPFAPAVRQYILKHYGENPDNYNEELKKLDQLRQSAVNVTRDFEGCSTLRKYFGQLHYLQSRIPMGSGQEAAVPITWTEIFSGKTVTVDEICYEQACILYNLGALHSMLGAMDSRVTEEGMKVSCTHFQCSAGAFSYLRDHFSHSYSMDMSHQILNLNINLMLGQAQECLLEKSMLDNRKSFLVARISAQVVDYYKEACRALENSETASLIGKFQKDWKKLVQMKIYYYAAVAHLHLGKQAEEQQKYGERLAYFQSALDKLNEAVKYAKGQTDNVQEALRFTMDVIGGKYNSAKKDNDFIYHEAVPPLDSLQTVKGASLVKALPVNPTDPSVTGTDIFSKLVPMEAHEASSLYSEEKAKLLREVVSKIESKNEALEQFMDSLRIDVETVDNLNQYSHIPPVLMEKCAALSVRPDTVKNLIQSMQVLSGVYTDVEASLRELKELIDQDELSEQKLQELFGKRPAPGGAAELSKEWARYMEVHEKASFTNTELHKAMNQHISNLRLLSGPLEQLRAALPTPVVSEEEKGVLHNMKRLLAKVEEMRDQRTSLEQQLRDTIQKDDITTTLVTTDHSEMKKLFEEQLKKYDQLKVYIDQNLSAQENVLRALTEANVKYAAVRKALSEAEHKWNSIVQMLVASFEAYEDLMKKSQEGKEFYADLEGKVTRLLEKARDICKSQEEQRQQILEREIAKKPPPRPTAPKPVAKASEADRESLSSAEDLDLQQLHAALSYSDLPEDLKSLPPDVLAAQLNAVAVNGMGLYPAEPGGFLGQRPPGPEAYLPAHRQGQRPMAMEPGYSPVYFRPPHGSAPNPALGPQYLGVSHSGPPSAATAGAGLPPHRMGPSVSCPQLPHPHSPSSPPPSYPAPAPPHFQARAGGSPQHGATPAPGAGHHYGPACPPVGPPTAYGTGQPVSSAMPMPLPVNANLHMVRPALAYPPPPAGQFAGQMPGANVASQQGPGIRPSTTTVDSVQTPISSFTPDPHQLHRQTMYGPPVGQYPYPHPGPPQPYSHQTPPHFAFPAPHQQPQPMFQHPGHIRAPVPGPPRQPYPGQFLPHMQVRAPPPPALQPHQPRPHPYPLPAHPPMPLGYPVGAVQPPAPGEAVPVTPASVPFAVPPPPPPLHPSPVPPPSPAPLPAPVPSSVVGQIQPPALGPGSPLPPTPAPSPQPAPMMPTAMTQRPPHPGTIAPPHEPGFKRQNSSTDDLLSSSPETPHGGPQASVTQPLLLPTKADCKEKPRGIQIIEEDPYEKPEHVRRLLTELGSFRAAVQSLERPACGSLTELDCKWKDLQDGQERDARQLSIAIARCYAMKNRNQDVMPYDKNRVVLETGKDDYINASTIEELSPYCPRFIATQAPLPGTAADFWLMVHEQKVSLVVMLVSEQEVEKQKVIRHLPTERGQQLVHGPITLTLTTQKITQTHVERMIGLQYREQSLKRTIIHLQFTSWPELGLPDSKSNLLRFIQEVHAHYLHQRPLHTPIVVHCSSGVGRTGGFCLLYAALQEVEAGNGIPDLLRIIRKMRQQRKHMLYEKLHLKFCYEVLLKHVEQVLQRHGVTTATSKATGSSAQKVYARQESQDLVLGGDLPISSIQATIAKLSIRSAAAGGPGGAGGEVRALGGEVRPTLEPGPATWLDWPSTDPLSAEGTAQELTTAPTASTSVPDPPPAEARGPETPPLAPQGPGGEEGDNSRASSLDLLASLTAEAFAMDSNPRNRQKISKENFLQPPSGQSLQPRPASADPLNLLDPLWTLNKT